MPTFEYKVKNKEGKIMKGRMSVLDKQKVIDKLQKNKLTIIEVMEVPEEEIIEKSKKHSKQGKFSIDLGVSDDEMAFFTRQLATIMNAGVSLNRIITILYNQAKSQKLKSAIYDIGSELQRGSSFTAALQKFPDIFDEMFISMANVGETSGTLPQAINRMADIIEKNLAIKKRIKAAMVYPMFILIFSGILCYILLVHFLPIFMPLFKEFGLNIEQDYPITNVLVKLSNLATNPYIMGAVIIIVVFLILFFQIAKKNKAVRAVIETVSFHIPIMSYLVRQAAYSRFCRSFANLTSAGVPLLRSLELTAGASGNAVVGASVEKVAKQVREGKSLSQALSQEKIFPELIFHMVNIGEEAGSLPDMLGKTADYFDQSLDNAVSAFTSVIEPAMMVFVGLIVGIFVTGVILPILSVTSKMKM